MIPQISVELRNRTLGRYGTEATPWLETLADAIKALCVDHQLTPKRQLASYEAIVFEADTPLHGRVVAKVGYPQSLAASINASRAFSGHGGVHVVAADDKSGLLLTRKIEPGDTLLGYFQRGLDDRATELAASAISRLRSLGSVPSGPFARIADHAKAFARNGAAQKALPNQTVRQAESMLVELLRTDAPAVLIHGDLHHDNLLVDNDECVYVIDPKGWIGDPAYEFGAWMRNPMDLYAVADVAKTLTRRLDIFCEILGDDRERMRNWSFVQMCLAAIWLYEDDQELWPQGLQLAELMLRA